LKLRDANGTLLDLPLDEITDEKAVTQSLMPENLIDGLTARQAADLVAYLMSLK
jgi:5,10-methylene-tetrahydrofolate dehydrogenase/methenyl tetrahydrofolate cyclohydrolase